MLDTCHYKFVQSIERTTSRVKPNVNDGLGVTLICHCSFITGNKYTTLVGDTDNGGGCACVRLGPGFIWEISVPPLIFAVKLKNSSKT